MHLPNIGIVTSEIVSWATENDSVMRVAIIDMGTNTFHLLMAELGVGEFTITYREKVPVKIGMGGINHGYITDEAIDRALTTMRSFNNTVKEAGVEKVMAFWNQCYAPEMPEMEKPLQKKSDETGIKTQLISGLKEAEYIYKGTRAAIKMGSEKCLIMDIGGGSVEFIIGNEQEIVWSHSFEIGGQRLLERFQKRSYST